MSERVTDERLRHLINFYPMLNHERSDILLALQELAERRAADKCPNTGVPREFCTCHLCKGK